MYRISNSLLSIYSNASYVPLIGSLTSTVNITIKLILKALLPLINETKIKQIKNNRFYRYIKYQPYQRLVLLALPFGVNNLIVLIYDFFNRKYNFKKYFLKELQKEEFYSECMYSLLIKTDKVLRDNLKIMLAVVEKPISGPSSSFLRYASKRLRDNYLLVKTAVTKDAMALKHAGPTQLNCDEIMHIASQHEYCSYAPLIYGNIRFRKDKELITNIAKKAQGSGHIIIKFMDDELQNDQEFMQSLIFLNHSLYFHVKPSIQTLPAIQHLYNTIIAGEIKMQDRLSKIFNGFFHFFQNSSAKKSLNALKEDLKQKIEDLKAFESSLITHSNSEGLTLEKLGFNILKGSHTPEAILDFNKNEKIDKEIVVKRFKKLSLLSHPDKNPDKPHLANAIFLCIKTAAQVLHESCPNDEASKTSQSSASSETLALH